MATAASAPPATAPHWGRWAAPPGSSPSWLQPLGFGPEPRMSEVARPSGDAPLALLWCS